MNKKFWLLIILTLVVSASSYPKPKLTTIWATNQNWPMVIMIRSPDTETCKYDNGCFTLSTVATAQVGLRSDGAVVWRLADMGQLLKTPQIK